VLIAGAARLAVLLVALTGYTWGGTFGVRTARPPVALDLVAVALLWATLTVAHGLLSGWVVLPGGLLLGALLGASVRGTKPVRLAAERAPRTLARPTGWRGHVWSAGNLQARLLLGFFYLIVVAPFALIASFGRDPLRLRRPATSSFWIARDGARRDLVAQRRQH
jgi:hypothetical protein